MWSVKSQLCKFQLSSSALAVAILVVVSASIAGATPMPNSATIETRTFNDCPISVLTTSNNYPASIQISDAMSSLCVSFANLHSWSFSEDGGLHAAVFNNNSNFRFAADFKIDGPGEGAGGLRISPWYSQLVDGRFEVNATTGEIACFGGALPFYNFTVNHGISYVRGTTIHLEATYRAHDLVATDPATIQYRVVYNGVTYNSPELPFAQGNPFDSNPYGLWGMLNNGRVGGYFQPRANTGATLTGTWSNVTYLSGSVATSFTLEPRVLNRKTIAKWVTGYIEVPLAYSASDINIGSIRLNGSVAVVSGAPATIGDFDRDGIPDLAVKFDRAAVIATVVAGNAVSVTVSGLVAGDLFSGTDEIRVNLP